MAPLRASLARSPPRLGRSQAGGLHPQTPRAAPPGAPSRTGPLLPRPPSRRGSGHGCDGGGGGQPLAVVHARRLAPPPPPWIQLFKSKATGAWASRRLVHRRASAPVAASVGRPRHRPQGGCPPWVGSGVVHGQSGPQGRAPAPPGTRFPPAAGAPPYVDS
jgi:hypothetical protein